MTGGSEKWQSLGCVCLSGVREVEDGDETKGLWPELVAALLKSGRMWWV